MKIEKVEKLIRNLQTKKEYIIHIKDLKQALNDGLAFEKLLRITKFNQKACLKSDIDVNTNPRKKAKLILKKY